MIYAPPHGATAVFTEQKPGDRVFEVFTFLVRRDHSAFCLNRFPQRQIDDRRVFAVVFQIFGGSRSAHYDNAVFDLSFACAVIPDHFPDIMLVGKRSENRVSRPFLPFRRGDTQCVQLIRDPCHTVSIAVQFENHFDDRCGLGIGFKGKILLLAVPNLYFPIPIRGRLPDEIAVFHRQKTTVVHDPLLIFQKLVSALQFAFEHIPIALVSQVIAVLQGDDDRFGITQDLHKTTDVFQIAAA